MKKWEQLESWQQQQLLNEHRGWELKTLMGLLWKWDGERWKPIEKAVKKKSNPLNSVRDAFKK